MLRWYIKYLIISFLLFHAVSNSYSQKVINENERIERLAALGRVWGAVKFFHPYLAYKNINWDKALVETIPLVNKARSSEEYKAAVNYMLSFLGDANTYAFTNDPSSTRRISDTAQFVRKVNSTTHLYCSHYQRNS